MAKAYYNKKIYNIISQTKDFVSLQQSNHSEIITIKSTDIKKAEELKQCRYCGSLDIVVNTKFNINSLETIYDETEIPYCKSCGRTDHIENYN